VADYAENRTFFQPEWDRYFKENPRELIRVDYPLNENSLVIDLGAHTGEHFASKMYSRYSCNIECYEPHPVTCAALRETFKYNPKIRIHEYALSNKNDFLDLEGSDLASSFTATSTGESHVVLVKRASEEFANIPHINLLKMNIEGAEFEILPDLIENYGMEKIDHVQVQFHTFVPDFKKRKRQIITALEQTHDKMWGYENVYESWSLKSVLH